jgi:hypothetical protein
VHDVHRRRSGDCAGRRTGLKHRPRLVSWNEHLWHLNRLLPTVASSRPSLRGGSAGISTGTRSNATTAPGHCRCASLPSSMAARIRQLRTSQAAMDGRAIRRLVLRSRARRRNAKGIEMQATLATIALTQPVWAIRSSRSCWSSASPAGNLQTVVDALRDQSALQPSTVATQPRPRSSSAPGSVGRACRSAGPGGHAYTGIAAVGG